MANTEFSIETLNIRNDVVKREVHPDHDWAYRRWTATRARKGHVVRLVAIENGRRRVLYSHFS